MSKLITKIFMQRFRLAKKRIENYRMNKILQRYKVVLPLILLAFLVTSCSGHEQKVAFYTFMFFVIFIILCLPAIILSAVARGNGSKSAKTTGIVFAAVGGFFALIYTYNLVDELRRIDEELIICTFLIWTTLVGALVLLVIPNPKIAKRERELQAERQHYQYQQQAPVFSSEAEILEYAENIKKKQVEENTVENSTYLNDDLNKPPEPPNAGPDMSGLDDLSDL
jgi:hypothetical protein